MWSRISDTRIPGSSSPGTLPIIPHTKTDTTLLKSFLLLSALRKKKKKKKKQGEGHRKNIKYRQDLVDLDAKQTSLISCKKSNRTLI